MHPIETNQTFTYWLYSDSDGGSIIDNSLGLNEKDYDPYVCRWARLVEELIGFF
ncbi:hypothetical protein BCR33DRAFT_723064 [Rhizoclosmatium globosum]|uniref:Uncharacterized protein n=1 Tax=Rhizoclosmatium globosum TaxID=329046 RepID=A0A1Y2BGB5_9FUNG|nr:hypothetical protein BCR33DRAFT_723064 [Rhizoclosmatium globosum]|eukprot:ORY33854.1 hypothetical protein BCR33DRAFT_723064 [Rhizoclosmatium globosum]